MMVNFKQYRLEQSIFDFLSLSVCLMVSIKWVKVCVKTKWEHFGEFAKRILFLLPWNLYPRSLAWTLTEIFASSIIRLIPRRGDKHNNWSGDFLNRLLTNYFDDVEHQLMNVDRSCWKTWKFHYLSFVISSNVLVGDKILIHIKKLKKYRILWQGHTHMFAR